MSEVSLLSYISRQPEPTSTKYSIKTGNTHSVTLKQNNDAKGISKHEQKEQKGK